MRIRVFIKEHGNSLSIVKIGTQVVANWRFNAEVIDLGSRFDPASCPHMDPCCLLVQNWHQFESTVDLRSTRVDVEPRSFQKLFDPSPIRHWVRQRMIGDSGSHSRSRP